MLKFIILYSLLSLLLVGCGPSVTNQQKIDSLKADNENFRINNEHLNHTINNSKIDNTKLKEKISTTKKETSVITKDLLGRKDTQNQCLAIIKDIEQLIEEEKERDIKAYSDCPSINKQA